MNFNQFLRAITLLVVAGDLGSGRVAAAPHVPASDSVVLERLPGKPGDPVQRELRSLRASLAADPRNPGRAATLARRYFDLAMAEGDPRYVGYAEAALLPWAQGQTPGEILVARGLLRQYRHDFDAALADLARALEIDPGDTDALAWRAAIFMVRADYAAARRECDALTCTRANCLRPAARPT